MVSYKDSKKPIFDKIDRELAHSMLTTHRTVSTTSLSDDNAKNQYERDAFENTKLVSQANPVIYDLVISLVSFFNTHKLTKEAVQDPEGIDYYRINLKHSFLSAYLDILDRDARKYQKKKLKELYYNQEDMLSASIISRTLDNLDRGIKSHAYYYKNGELFKTNRAFFFHYDISQKTDSFANLSLYFHKIIFQPLVENTFDSGYVKVPHRLFLHSQNAVRSVENAIITPLNLRNFVLYSGLHDNKKGPYIRVSREDFIKSVVPNLMTTNHKNLRHSYKTIIDSIKQSSDSLTEKIEWDKRIARSIYLDDDIIKIHFQKSISSKSISKRA